MKREAGVASGLIAGGTMFTINTPDPAFAPGDPVAINGYGFVPLANYEALRDDLRRVQTNTAQYREESRREVVGKSSEVRRLESWNGHLRNVLTQIVRPPANVERAREVCAENRTAAEVAEISLWMAEVRGNAIRFVAELATMTDIEADFLDGVELREVARLLQVPDDDGERAPTLPRLYSNEDRGRAIAATQEVQAFLNADRGRLVDAVAEALGMRRAGA